MAEERKISPAIIIAAGAGVAAAAVGIYALARRAAPPEEEIPPEELPPEVRPRILSATWKTTYNQYGGFYGQLVKAVITVDSPVAFTGELKVSLPGEITGISLINSDQQQAKIAYAEQSLAECDTARCRELRTLSLERERDKPQVDPEGEFYPSSRYSTGLKYRVYGHYSKMDAVRDSISHTVDFPEGTSTFDIAFFLRPDYFRYSYSRGELRWVDKPYYLPALHSPKVELYDEAGSLLDSVTYEDAIEVKPVDEYPVSVDIPASVVSGGECWAGFAMFLPYKRNCDYEISLYTGAPYYWQLAFGEVVDINWYNRKDNWYLGGAEPISADGQFTFRGLLALLDEPPYFPYFRVPAKAIYKTWRLGPYEPVPPGIYKVFMRCNLKFISYASDTATKYSGGGLKWRGIEVGEIEVV